MSAPKSNIVNVGKLCGVYGIKGWVKVKSFTQPPENLFQYDALYLKTRHGVKPVKFVKVERNAKGFVASIEGVSDRTAAELIGNVDIAADKCEFPELQAGDYYWHQLIGLTVFTQFDDADTEETSQEGGELGRNLGVVSNLMETGANDVLVIDSSDTSIDSQQRLVPYVLGQYVKRVDLESGCIWVDWDPEF